MDTIIEKSPAAEDLWVEHLSPIQGCALRLFCFPYAGGGAHVFCNWQRHFPPDIDICLVHLPGRGKRIGERPFTRLTALVDKLADIVFQDTRGPFALYGHSMGALISFELARELRRRNRGAPQGLFLSGRRAPTASSREGPTFNLPHDEFVAKLKRFNHTSGQLLEEPELKALFLPLLRADFELVDSYTYYPEDPLPCPISVYGGLQDEFVSLDGLREWKQQTSSICETRLFAGDHFFIHNLANDFLNVLRRDVLAASTSNIPIYK
jgi:medium-chain acyl-[acyl-carrier-protein] hydrolase